MSDKPIDCRDCIFSYRWKDWGVTKAAANDPRQGWVGTCLLQPSATGRPKEVRGGMPVCGRFIKHGWPEHIVLFARGVENGKLIPREENESDN
ncbi:hypothetical protein EHM92_09885 [bacterium]|nr:MAG: hypothetical protein EHM92_09885 [bacterium]